MTNEVDETGARLTEAHRVAMVKYVQLNDAFGKRLDGKVGAPGTTTPFIVGSAEFDETTRIMEERDAAQVEYDRTWQELLAYNTAQRP